MVDGFQADSLELTRLASEVLTAADGLGTALSGQRSSLIVPLAAFGNSAAGPAGFNSYESAAEQGTTTSERLVEVLAGDVDRLYRTAFAYEKLERENASVACHLHPRIGPIPC